MNKFTIIGLLSWGGSLLLLGFQGISTLVDPDGEWISKTLEDFLDVQYLDWIDGLTNATLQSAADYIVTMPLFILLLVVGLIFFVIGGFIKE